MLRVFWKNNPRIVVLSTRLKNKRRLHERKTEHFKALSQVDHASAVADHLASTSHNVKWVHFETIASGQSDLQCKIIENS